MKTNWNIIVLEGFLLLASHSLCAQKVTDTLKVNGLRFIQEKRESTIYVKNSKNHDDYEQQRCRRRVSIGIDGKPIQRAVKVCFTAERIAELQGKSVFVYLLVNRAGAVCQVRYSFHRSSALPVSMEELYQMEQELKKLHIPIQTEEACEYAGISCGVRFEQLKDLP